jgi:CheY-like chemotaxis protein
MKSEFFGEFNFAFRGDFLRLREILMNLLSNSLKFTHDGEIIVKVHCLPNKFENIEDSYCELLKKYGSCSESNLFTHLQLCFQKANGMFKRRKLSDGSASVRKLSDTDSELNNVPDCWYMIEVHDTGEGIPPEFLSRLFGAFEQADTSRSRSYEGTGLGLNISRSLTELMGGKLTAYSRHKHGSCFAVLFPVENSRVISTEPSPVPTELSMFKSPQAKQSKVKLRDPEKSIIVVDDNAINLKVFEKLLSDFHFKEVRLINNGKDAIEYIDKHLSNVSCVLLDLHMPVVDGYAVIKFIRNKEKEFPEIEKLPVVAITADVMPETKTECISCGFDYVLTKPLTKKTLATVLEKLNVFSLETN